MVSCDRDDTAAVTVDNRSRPAPLRNKGPPARGLIWLKREQMKRMSKSSDDVAESDEDYEPSEQSSEDEDCSS